MILDFAFDPFDRCKVVVGEFLYVRVSIGYTPRARCLRDLFNRRHEVNKIAETTEPERV